MKKYILATLLTLASAVTGGLAAKTFVPNEINYQTTQVQHTEQKFGAVQNTKFVGTLPTTLSGAGITTSAASIGVSSLTLKQSGYLLSIVDFGTTAYLTLEPGNSSRQEFASCTGITQNSNGTAVFTTCTRGLAPIYPYTASTTFAFTHGGGTTVIVSNSPPFYNNFAVQNNDANITGNYVFSQVPHVSTTTVDADITNATTSLVTYNLLQNTSFAGTVNASTIVKGITQIATALQQASSTGTLSTGAIGVMTSGNATDTPKSGCSVGFTGIAGAGCSVIAQLTGKISQAWIDLTANFTWTGQHSFSATTTMATTTRTGAEVGTFGLSVGTTTATTTGNLIVIGNASTTNLTINSTGVFNGWASSTAYEIITQGGSSAGTNQALSGAVTATCSTGKVVIGGGIGSLSGGIDIPAVAESRPSGNNAWVAQTRSYGNGAATSFTVYAICVRP